MTRILQNDFAPFAGFAILVYFGAQIHYHPIQSQDAMFVMALLTAIAFVIVKAGQWFSGVISS